jgi:methyl-accepting chemotaxis protein
MSISARPFALQGLRTRSKLSLGFGSILLLMVLVGALSAAGLRATNQVTEDINDNWLPTVRGTLQLRALLTEFRTQEFEQILAADDGERKPREARMLALATEFESLQRHSVALPSAAEQTATWEQLGSTWQAYLVENKKIRALAQADQADSARALIRARSQQLYATAMAALDKLAGHGVARSEDAKARSHASYTHALGVIGGGILVALLLGFGLAWQLGRHIAVPLAHAAQVATTVAKGDLRVALPTHRRDEIGDLYAALRTMVAGLSGVVVGVRSGVDGIASSSGEIASGTQDLSDRTERQASALQQTTSTLAQLSEAATQTAQTASEASSLAGSAREVALKTGQIVDSVVERMDDITQSSRRINDITGVIDGLAFQTNILALNAAVEAARAGEQGRGFAVVAGEVRLLAQRSAQAAKEIRGLITDSAEKVAMGTSLVNDAGLTMRDIAGRVDRLSGLIDTLASASTGQRDGMAEVSRAVASLDATTQQNAAMVEQSAAASASLLMQTANLSEAVAVFQV